jgi:hypothetical protein
MRGVFILSFRIPHVSDTIYFVEHKQINKQRRNDMDRSMKVMFGMMTIAICLLAFTMMGNQSQQAYAGEYVGGDRGTEPTIVSFRVTPISAAVYSGNVVSNPTTYVLLTRMWSDGAVEVNVVGKETLEYGNNFYASEIFTGWRTVTDSVAGYACGGDTDGNRSVNVHDLLAVVEQWGQCEEDPPLGLPDDGDLM